MWLITPHGMFSAVQHRDNPDLIVVRSRVKADALYLAQFCLDVDNYDVKAAEDLLVTYEFSDYPWRVIVYRDTWASFLATEAHADHLNYGNVKDAVKARQGEQRAQVYMGVWSALLRLEDQDPDATPRRTVQGLLDAHWDDDRLPLHWLEDPQQNAAETAEPDGTPWDEPWTITLDCGCRVDMDNERMVDPCARHAEPPF